MAGRAEGCDPRAGSRRDPLEPARPVRDADRLGGGAVMRQWQNSAKWSSSARVAGCRGFERLGALGLLAAVLMAPGCAAQKSAPPLEVVPAKLLAPVPSSTPQESTLDQQPSEDKMSIESYTRVEGSRLWRQGFTARFPYAPNSQPVF